MKLMVIPLSIVIISLIIMVSTSQAMAFSMPSVNYSYNLTASSPIDDPSSAPVEVRPGQKITVKATANLTYHGIKMTSPPISVRTELYLLEENREISSSIKTETVASIMLEDNMTYSRTGSGYIKVPADTEPGNYTLNCIANAQAGWMGLNLQKGATQSYKVKVISKKSLGTDSTLWSINPGDRVFGPFII